MQVELQRAQEQEFDLRGNLEDEYQQKEELTATVKALEEEVAKFNDESESKVALRGKAADVTELLETDFP